MQKTALENKTVSDLRTMARKLDLSGYSRMRKDELIKAISKARKKKVKSKTKKKLAKTVKATAQIKSKKPVRASRKQAKPETGVEKSKTPATLPQPPALKIVISDEEQRVEDAKYVTARPGTPPPTDFVDDLGEDLDKLPPLNGPRLTLLPQKPGVFHAHWALASGHLAKQPGLRLRLSSLSRDTITLLEEIALPANQGYWYFQTNPALDASKVYLQLGFYNENSKFVTAIERGIVRIPRLAASPHTDQRWWISEKEFRQLYLAAGGRMEGGSLLWPTCNQSSWHNPTSSR
ncbi:MAG: hypothetical protein BMS9Abin33_1004 [Gammaproteobacteria bacterium]|nr:MAG: hypothetical protein BMS9Abin33_1004 [Gammaproteobacteria bacterium]